MGDPDEIELDDSDLVVEPVRRVRRLGRYVLCYELASGGMATVYLARASGAAGFQKLVAIKIIHPHLAKEKDFVEMFLDEARIASGINHPNVCSVFDFGEADGTYFLAMEYLVGETAARLARTLAKNPDALPPDRFPAIVGYVFQQACEGLHAAHELRGQDGTPLHVVHRDMTPHNLFVGYDGSVRVVDFGVASAVGRMHETSTGTLKGKFAYMSPEQARQQQLDRRSDIWSLGVSMWEMLTRRRLFRRDGEFETLQAVVSASIEPPSTIRPHVPPELDAIVMRALERDPAKRFATAREMGRALGRVVSAAGGASSADLADVMDALYADERRQRRELLDRARRMDPDEPSTSAVRAAPVLSLEGDSGTASMPSRTIATTTPSLRRRWAIPALAAAGLLAVVVGVAWATSGSEEEGAAPEAPTGDVVEAVEAATAPAPTEAEAPGVAEPAAAVPVEAPLADPATPEPIEPPPAQEATPDTERAVRMSRPSMTRTRSAPAPSGRGRLHVATPPGWADIYVDGRHVGRSPTELTLAAGAHRVRLMPYGEGPPVNRRVTIEADGTARLVVRLGN